MLTICRNGNPQLQFVKSRIVKQQVDLIQSNTTRDLLTIEYSIMICYSVRHVNDSVTNPISIEVGYTNNNKIVAYFLLSPVKDK